MFHLLIYNFLMFLSNMIWSNKNGYLSVTLISTSMLGHVPISCLKLKASLYLYNIYITSFCSLCRHVLFKSIYFSNISLSDTYFLSSVLSNHGYFSPVSSFSPFFKVFLSY